MSFGYTGITDTFVHSPFSLDDFYAAGEATNIDAARGSPHHGASFQSLDVTRWRGQVGTRIHTLLNPCKTINIKVVTAGPNIAYLALLRSASSGSQAYAASEALTNTPSI